MAKTLTLEIPDDVYEPILKRAAQIGQTPEQIISQWIENAVKQATTDPLLQLAGAFESEVSDISERHDEYIGQSLRSNHE
jgi:hypothetical protein